MQPLLTTFVQGHTANITVIENPREIIETYRNAVALAKVAGFDGVELLAQGYAQDFP